MRMSRYTLSLLALLLASGISTATAQVTTEQLRLKDSAVTPHVVTVRTPGTISSSYSFLLPATPMPGNGSLLYGANAVTGQLGWLASPSGDGTNVLTVTNNTFSYASPSTLFGGVGWLIMGNTGLTDTTNYLGTLDNQSIRFISGSGGPHVRMIIDTTGRIGVNADTARHQLDARNTGTTDEFAAVRGVATAATTNQAIGVWGDASNNGAGSSGGIAVLATGNASPDTARVNTALQIADGSLRIGRTREVGPEYVTDSAGVSGVEYSAEGPSGVIRIDYGAGLLGGLLGIGQTLIAEGITINNRYVTPQSIVLLEIIDYTPGIANRLLGVNILWSKAVRNRRNGAFDLWVTLQNLGLLGLTVGTNNSVTIGYVVINPTK